MLIHPWDAATGSAEWRDWLAATDRFGMPAVGNLDPGPGPAGAALHFTVVGKELLMHLARPNPVWPPYWRARAGGPDEDGVPTSPVEHRERVIDRLGQRGHGFDTGAAAQQRRRLAAIGDWKTHRDRP